MIYHYRFPSSSTYCPAAPASSTDNENGRDAWGQARCGLVRLGPIVSKGVTSFNRIA
jgi:hypothetical protein